jgi:hypothetical protein
MYLPVILTFFTLFLCLLFFKQLLINRIQYVENQDYIILKNPFSDKEIEEIQDCIGPHKTLDQITGCFSSVQRSVITKVKASLGQPYMSIGLARLSNNNNNDAQSFHRDIKPLFGSRHSKTRIFTIICYFDEASLSMGNRVIESKPGDIIVFNSFNLHKAMLSPFSTIYEEGKGKQRRVLQFFHVFLDKKDETAFYNNHVFCQHANMNQLLKYTTAFFDLRFWLEYFNMTRFINIDCDETDFMTNINHDSYITTIDNIPYYHYF